MRVPPSRAAKFYKQLRQICAAPFGARLAAVELHYLVHNDADWNTLGLVESLLVTRIQDLRSMDVKHLINTKTVRQCLSR